MLALPTAVSSSFLPSITLYEEGIVAPVGSCANNRTLHLIRHAQGWHNVDELEVDAAFKAGDKRWSSPAAGELDLHDPTNVKLRTEYGVAWMLLERVTGRTYHDPHLTPKGREQSYALRSRLRGDPDFAVDAVALSPMRRTIETALLSLPQLEGASTTFAWAHGDDPPRSPPMVATELLRERCAHFMPDSRRTRTELAAEYGRLGANASISFAQIDEMDTPFLEGAERDEPEHGSPLLAERAEKALRWLAALPAEHQRIVVVSHKHFLGALTGLHPETVAQRAFENAERRTVLMCVGDASASCDGGDGDDDEASLHKPMQARRDRVKPLEHKKRDES